ncbi:hypothetical protein Bsph_4280 [Lysinibacillus sphaericus C3-41]|uniref:Uncharacterized protein n=1 Tax=Lysinibacillus sphaericus (strain C3-41) TaxID=444177 RepID=B1HY24_LYSSC|nr:hypothetical protein [Lysinibacillus sphaericus]ACA41739.1 hypothetical protein Bsph_4280 [Lysinibacillus sphaericus C3-41]
MKITSVVAMYIINDGENYIIFGAGNRVIRTVAIHPIFIFSS